MFGSLRRGFGYTNSDYITRDELRYTGSADCVTHGGLGISVSEDYFTHIGLRYTGSTSQYHAVGLDTWLRGLYHT